MGFALNYARCIFKKIYICIRKVTGDMEDKPQG